MNWININVLFTKLDRDLGFNIDEDDAIEWAGEAMDFIGMGLNLTEAVAFVEVKKGKAMTPLYMHNIIQVARDNSFNKDLLDKDDCICPSFVISETVVEEEEEGPYIPVALDCYGTPINGYSLAYYRPFFDLFIPYGNWVGSDLYLNRFTPIHLATSTFFDALVCREADDIRGLYKNGTDEYKPKGEYIQFNFQEGLVAIAYLKNQVDLTTGYPMIPDDISVKTAITMYIRMKTLAKRYDEMPERYGQAYLKAESDWHWYVRQSKNKRKIPKTIDQLQNIRTIRSYVIPPQRNYNNFFGSLNRMDRGDWKNPRGNSRIAG